MTSSQFWRIKTNCRPSKE